MSSDVQLKNIVRNLILHSVSVSVQGVALHLPGRLPIQDKQRSAAVCFPREIEEHLDALPLLYSRLHIHVGLAGAAVHGNGRAFYHLAQIVETQFFGDWEQDPSISEFRSFLLKQAEQIAKQSNDLVLQSWLIDDRIQSQPDKAALLQSAVDSATDDRWRKGEALYYLAFQQPEPLVGRDTFERSASLGYKQSLVQLARLSETPEQAYDLYLKAGEQGVADGFFYAACLLERNPLLAQQSGKTTEPLCLYRKAAELGQMHSWIKVMEILIEQGRPEAELDEIAQQMQLEGDYCGYRKLGDFYRSRGDNDKAFEYYFQAGPLEGFYFAAQVVTDGASKTHLTETADAFRKEHFTKLCNYLHHKAT